ncbi:MAG TPA: FMN-binding protein [Thermoleophilia bacterium]|nr:FMN-binding protein [Thermoleophilia bacterium]
MRRALIAIAATVAGLALVLGYRPHAQAAQTTPAPALSTSATPQPSATQGSSQVYTATGTDEPLADGLGDLAVKVSVSNGRIVDVGMGRLNLQGPQSAQISDGVLPALEQQTLTAQSANIQGVSGATYTTQAYVASLQSALDKIAAMGGASQSS